MAKKISAQAKTSETDPVFENQIKKLRARAKDEGEALPNTEQSSWMTPELGDYDGDPFNVEGIADAFNRDKANEQFKEAVTDAESPGVTGDLVITTLEVSYLEIMERAYRCRHTMRRPRAVLQACARKRGHGNDRGALTQTLAYVRNLMAEAKSPE